MLRIERSLKFQGVQALSDFGANPIWACKHPISSISKQLFMLDDEDEYEYEEEDNLSKLYPVVR